MVLAFSALLSAATTLPSSDISTLQNITAAVAALGAFVATLIAFATGIVSRVKLGAFVLEGSPREKQEATALVKAVTDPSRQPFEIEQLSNYYSQTLNQSKTSFWFSLIFASIGFFVIISAAFLYQTGRTGATVASLGSGTIIEVVSALFFVQSKRAQESMASFFEKLRKDREQMDALKLSDKIADPAMRDALKVRLALHLAGVPDGNVIAGRISDRNGSAPVMPISSVTVKRSGRKSQQKVLPQPEEKPSPEEKLIDSGD